MTTLAGHCHCGAIRVEFETGKPVAELPLRSCQCGFCRRHGARTTSDPTCRLYIEAAPGSINRYRFGRRAVEALICDECGAKGARRATGQAAREACEAVGWVTAGNRDHCPDCAKS